MTAIIVISALDANNESHHKRGTVRQSSEDILSADVCDKTYADRHCQTKSEHILPQLNRRQTFSHTTTQLSTLDSTLGLF